eukprot:RCo000122
MPGEKEKGRVSCTNAMGLNITAASIVGWKQLILKEEQARAQWQEKYAANLTAEQDQLIERVKNRPKDVFERSLEEDTILRDGISKEGKGRLALLKTRQMIGPQEKYRRPLTESQRIGWTCVELPPVSENTLHFGRKPIIANNFYRRTGPFKQGSHSGQTGLNMVP